MTRVLITGGLGFLGSALVTEFAAAGFDVRIFSRQGHRPKGFVHPVGHPMVWGDIRDEAAVSRAVEGMDIVVHTVSNFREARTDHQAYPINVGGTDNVLHAAARSRVARVVLCSTIGVHGNVARVPADEDSPYNPGDIYQETKVEVERRARLFEREQHIPVCILRPTSLYGPGDLRMLKLFRMIQRRRFVLIGKGDANFHPAYIDDVARAFVLGAIHDRAAGDTFIIGGEGYLHLRELIDTIARQLQVSPPSLRIPLWPVDLLAKGCEAVCAPFEIEPPLHRRRMSFFRNNRGFSIEKARRVLGYQPRASLETGLERTITWYEANGYLRKRPALQGSDRSVRPTEAVARPEAAPAADTSRSSL
jgi:dihydroflavonol-4-reductase